MRAILIAIALVVLLATPRARADVISEEQADCNGHKAGDPCETEGHACAAETCSHIHYTPNGPSGTESYACLVCRPGAPAASGGGGGSSRPLIIGIAVGVVMLGGGIALAYRRRRPAPT